MRDITALALISGTPTLSVLTTMVFKTGKVGQAIFLFNKVWLLLFPTVWHLAIERKPISYSVGSRKGLLPSIMIGTIQAIALVVAWWIAGDFFVDQDRIRDVFESNNLSGPYLVGAIAYWIVVNAFAEEYCFRWFIGTRLERLMDRNSAVLVSGFIFMVHHAVAISVYSRYHVGTILASLYIWFVGCTLAWLYTKYQSIWYPYLTHFILDIAVFGIALRMLTR